MWHLSLGPVVTAASASGLSTIEIIGIILGSIIGLCALGGTTYGTIVRGVRDARKSDFDEREVAYIKATNLLRGRVDDLEGINRATNAELASTNSALEIADKRIQGLKADVDRYRDDLSGATAWKSLEAALRQRDETLVKLLKTQHTETLAMLERIGK